MKLLKNIPESVTLVSAHRMEPECDLVVESGSEDGDSTVENERLLVALIYFSCILTSRKDDL